MSLGALFVQRGIATTRHLEDALACQVIYGDDLVTNLLEVTYLDETLALAALSEWHGLPAVEAGTLVVELAAKQRVPLALAREWEIVPVAWQKGVLTIAVATPLARKAEEELEHELGCSVAQRVTLLVRVREALRTHFRVGTDPRVDRLLLRLSGEREPASGRKTTPSEHPTLNLRSPRPAFMQDPIIASSPPAGASAPPPSRQLALLLEALERAEHRDQVLARVLEYVAAKVSYCALFVVQANQAIRIGRDGKIATGAFALSLSLAGPSFLASARARTRVMIVGERRESGDLEVLRALERTRVQECAVVPVVVRGRVVGLLYIDGDEKGLLVRVAGEMESLADAAGRAFERIIVSRKNGDGRLDDDRPSNPAGAPSLKPQGLAAILGGTTDVPGSAMPALPPPPVSQPPMMEGVLPPQARVPALGGLGFRSDDIHERMTVERVPPAAASSSRVLGAHTPPPAKPGMAERLPSIIVNLDDDFAALVERVVQPAGDEQAEAELLRQGHAAMPAIMRNFPGPVPVEDPLEATQVPKASECGPLLRLIAGQRKAALPFVLSVIENGRDELVTWALLLLTDLPYVEAIGPAVSKLFAQDKRVAKAARLTCIALARLWPQDAVDAVSAYLFDEGARDLAIVMLGELGQGAAVPVLVQLLDGDGAVLARRSLMDITRHDLGSDVAGWGKWWETNCKRHRVEWLIDALSGADSVLRRLAANELVATTGQRFGYDAGLSERERVRAQERFRAWWATEGRGK